MAEMSKELKWVENGKIVTKVKDALNWDGSYSFDDLLHEIHCGKAQSFENDCGCWITTIKVYPLKTILHVWIIAGDLPGVSELQQTVIEFALSKGCTQITALGRNGWEKVAPKHGWKCSAIELTLEPN